MNFDYSLLRKEIKYIIPLQKVMSIKNSLDNLLPKDRYNENGIYTVKSLYFDSVNNIDFSEKLAGAEIRKKVRLRTYNENDSLCKMELKEKTGDWQQKQGFLVSKSDAEELLHGNYNILKKYFQLTETSMKVYGILMLGRYRPVVLIKYDRIAYQYPMYDTRITLDMNIRASESNLNLFSRRRDSMPVMHGKAILEIKYSGKLMGFISDALSRFGLTQNAYSKYCSARRNYYDFNY
ncbi:polyphosphate polymerase domain-containing protein [Lachnospiraceae bacterium 54-11]